MTTFYHRQIQANSQVSNSHSTYMVKLCILDFNWLQTKLMKVFGTIIDWEIDWESVWLQAAVLRSVKREHFSST